MDFGALTHRFKIFFSFFGFVHFSARTRVLSTCSTRFARNLPAICYLLILIVLYMNSLYFQYGFANFHQTVKTIIVYTNISSEALLQISIIAQALVFHKQLKKLCSTYEFIQRYMKSRMGRCVKFNEFQKRISHLVIVVIVPYLGTAILRKTLITNHTDTVFNDIVLTFYFLSSMAQIHIIVHIELLNYFLTLTKQWLHTRSSDFSATRLYQRKDLLKMQQLNGYNEVLHLKLIHFKLWEVSININKIFGWSLGAIFLRNFIEIAYGAYWIYMFSSQGKYLFSTRTYMEHHSLGSPLHAYHINITFVIF